MRRIVLLLPMAEDNPVGLARISALVKELQQLGWTVGRNMGVDVRSAGANVETIRKHAMEWVELAPDVILAQGSVTVTALLQATRRSGCDPRAARRRGSITTAFLTARRRPLRAVDQSARRSRSQALP